MTISLPAEIRKKTSSFNLWASMPHEIKIHVLSYLLPKELVRASRVSKEFYKMCFDGQLWTCFDASEFYKEIPAESLAKIIVAAGPFVKDLNLRGCVQVEHYKRAEVVVKACRNLINATLEGCRNFQRTTLHSLLSSNQKLANLNLTGLTAVTNATCDIIAESCPQLEMFNVSWCKHMDAKGIQVVIQGCKELKDLRAGEIKGFNNLAVAKTIFRTNNLERLVLTGCEDLSDAALQTMVQGSTHPELDILTNHPIVPPRKLRHLDLTRCVRLSTQGVKALGGNVLPNLEGLQLNGITSLTDDALEPILATAPRLTHLELEDLAHLTNSLFSEHLAKAPCAARLEHLSISYCENIGDAGMLPVFRNCVGLRSVIMDNTRVSDLTLAEAVAMAKKRGVQALVAAGGDARRDARDRNKKRLPVVGLSLTVYDCQNVTWTGVREVLSRNSELVRVPVVTRPSLPLNRPKQKETTEIRIIELNEGEGGNGNSSGSGSDSDVDSNSEGRGKPLPAIPPSSGSLSIGGGDDATTTTKATTTTRMVLPAEIISLKCFYGWQMTVDEHTKRVLRGDVQAAGRLERKWADYMQASEEAGITGINERRRRRRAREAQAAHANEEGDAGHVNGGGRRRARTAACVVM